ncbi:MAG TPA: dienelactone hydrolase family protein [Candidatus Baltobacteraceae bacterium]|nr:dienelactone hydrolase family protein [Candidatus Baltobacteraceae bacterium]
MGQMIEFMRPDGQRAPGYLASPEKDAESAPGIVIIEEWWGVTADIMRVANEYAALGYRALVPDLFRGRTAAIGDEANHLLEGLDFADAYSQDARGALTHLKRNGKKAGITGYCIGGSVAMLAAMHLREPDSAVVFYGFPGPEGGDPATIEIPVQCHFAKGDEFFTPARGGEIEARMKEGKVPYEVYWYDAKHGFCNPNPVGSAGLGHYDASAAHEAWERAVRFWKNTLHE